MFEKKINLAGFFSFFVLFLIIFYPGSASTDTMICGENGVAWVWGDNGGVRGAGGCAGGPWEVTYEIAPGNPPGPLNESQTFVKNVVEHIFAPTKGSTIDIANLSRGKGATETFCTDDLRNPNQSATKKSKHKKRATKKECTSFGRHYSETVYLGSLSKEAAQKVAASSRTAASTPIVQ